MTLFKGCYVVKCDEAGKPAEGEMSVQFKVVELGNSNEYDPETKQVKEKALVLLEKVR